MYMREYMHTNVITVPPDTLIDDAHKIMQEHNIKRLPVVDKGKLVGLITRDKIRGASSPPATSLSIWELNYLLSRMKVKDIMAKNLITVTPDTTVEDAVQLGHRNQIGALLVVDKGKLVGIVTSTDVFDILVDILGFGKPGVRLHVIDCPKGWRLRAVIDSINNHGATIQALFTVTPPGLERCDTIVRLDVTDASPLVEELKTRGYNVEVRYH